jgi:hypothetical protein
MAAKRDGRRRDGRRRTSAANGKLGGRPRLVLDWTLHDALLAEGIDDRALAIRWGLSLRTLRRRRAERQAAAEQRRDQTLQEIADLCR